MSVRIATALSLFALLAGCEMLGMESPEKIAAFREGEGKAVGSACRHANRALEDCYALNPKAVKAAVFAGWREMDEYMREHRMESVSPTIAHSTPRSDAKPAAAPAERKPAAGGTAKGGAAYDS